MHDIFISVLPLAIASAASPVILAVAIALLSKNEKISAYAFLAGGVIAAALLACMGASVAAVDDKVTERVGLAPSAFSVALGTVFIAFGLKILIEKERETADVPQSGKKRGAAKWLAIGFAGNVTNFDAVLLNIAAVREIFNANIDMGVKLLALAMCDFFYLSPALIPVLIYSIAPRTAEKVLTPLGATMTKYGKYIVGAIFVVFGLVLIFRGN